MFLTPSRPGKVTGLDWGPQIDQWQVQHHSCEFETPCSLLVLILIRYTDNALCHASSHWPYVPAWMLMCTWPSSHITYLKSHQSTPNICSITWSAHENMYSLVLKKFHPLWCVQCVIFLWVSSYLYCQVVTQDHSTFSPHPMNHAETVFLVLRSCGGS